MAAVTSIDSDTPRARQDVAAGGRDTTGDQHGLPWVGRAAVTGWGVLVAIAIVLGPDLLPEGPEVASLRAPPVMGQWRFGGGPAVAFPLILAAATVVYGPRLAATLRWRTLVAVAGVATAAWCVALAAVDGWYRVAFPLSGEHEYLAVVDRIEGPGHFLETFVERLDGYPIHVQGHPPGMPLLLWGMDRLGMAGTGWTAGLVLAGAALATSATLLAVRSVAGGNDLAAGEHVARRAAPFVALAPAAVWLGTTADAFFAGVIALGIALLVAVRGHAAVYVVGGAVLGCALFLTYGAVPLLTIPAGVWLYRRDVRPLLWAALGAAAVTAIFWAGGFWWFDGLEVTKEAYEAGVSQDRPYELFVRLFNPAAFALAVGPAVACALGVLLARGRQLPVAVWLLPMLAFAAVSVANFSGLSKAEVERIWLPFVPWLLVLTALLPRPRLWLAVQVVAGLSLQLFLHSPW